MGKADMKMERKKREQPLLTDQSIFWPQTTSEDKIPVFGEFKEKLLFVASTSDARHNQEYNVDLIGPKP